MEDKGFSLVAITFPLNHAPISFFIVFYTNWRLFSGENWLFITGGKWLFYPVVNTYFIALLECDGNGLTFTNINRQINDKYGFENYKSGNYSIDGFINYRKSYNSFEETSYLANIENSELTFKDGNDIYHLKFGINYKVEGTQQDPNTIKLTYSDFSINNISLNNISNSSLKLSVEAINRIKKFVLYFEK